MRLRMACLTKNRMVCRPMVWHAHCINHIEEDSTDHFLPLEEEIQRAYVDGYPSETLQSTRKDLERLGKYLRRMLIVDPQQRAAAAELELQSWSAIRHGPLWTRHTRAVVTEADWIRGLDRLDL